MRNVQVKDIPHWELGKRSRMQVREFSSVWITFCSYIHLDRDSEVELETRFGLDGPRSASRWGARFPKPVQTGPVTLLASCTISTSSLYRNQSCWNMALIANPYLASRLKKEYSYAFTAHLEVKCLFKVNILYTRSNIFQWMRKLLVTL